MSNFIVYLLVIPVFIMGAAMLLSVLLNRLRKYFGLFNLLLSLSLSFCLLMYISTIIELTRDQYKLYANLLFDAVLFLGIVLIIAILHTFTLFIIGKVRNEHYDYIKPGALTLFVVILLSVTVWLLMIGIGASDILNIHA